jgi:hypothetical protein
VIDLTGVGQGSVNIEDNQMHYEDRRLLGGPRNLRIHLNRGCVHFVILLAARSERVSES